MKTMQDLELELDEATSNGDLDAVDRIYAEMEALEAGNGPATAVNDVAEGDDGDPLAAAPDADGSSTGSDGDGKGDHRLIPLSEAKKARQEAAQYREEAEKLKQQVEEMRGNPQTDPAVAAELDRLKRLTAAYEDQIKKHDLQPAVLPEEFRLTPERLAEVEAYGDLGEVVAALARQNEFLTAQIRANATAGKQGNATDDTDADPRMAIINGDGDLKRWFQSDLAWSEVQKVDAYLETLPAFAGKPLSDRIPKLKEMVRNRLGEPAGDPAPTPSGKPNIRERLPSSLTDIGGADAGAEASFEDRFKDKSELEMLPELEKLLKSGKSIDDILEAGNTGIL